MSIAKFTEITIPDKGVANCLPIAVARTIGKETPMSIKDSALMFLQSVLTEVVTKLHGIRDAYLTGS